MAIHYLSNYKKCLIFKYFDKISRKSICATYQPNRNWAQVGWADLINGRVNNPSKLGQIMFSWANFATCTYRRWLIMILIHMIRFSLFQNMKCSAFLTCFFRQLFKLFRNLREYSFGFSLVTCQIIL